MRRHRDEHLAAVLEDTAPDLLRYLTRRVTIPEDAADLLGQVGLTAWRRRRAAPRDPHEARLWLFGIARNTLANHWRSGTRTLALTDQLKQELRTGHAGPDIAEQVATQETIRAALAAIPTESAEILRLVHWEDLPLVDAATALGIPASTARSRYATAKDRLRRHMQTSQEPSSGDTQTNPPALKSASNLGRAASPRPRPPTSSTTRSAAPS